MKNKKKEEEETEEEVYLNYENDKIVIIAKDNAKVFIRILSGNPTPPPKPPGG